MNHWLSEGKEILKKLSNMKPKKLNQQQRIARLEKLFTQMYLKLEAFRVRLDKCENKHNEDKTTG